MCIESLMTTPNPLLPDLPHVTPVACPACGNGRAHLVRLGPDAMKRDGKTEIWSFKCDGCGREYSQTVET
jgi:transposase-like protein